MTTRGPASPDRRAAGRRTAPPPTGSRRVAPSGAVRRDGRAGSTRVRPNRSATPRPAIRRVTPPPGPRTTTGPRLTVTTRAAILGLTLCLVALTMAYPLRAFLTQRATIADLRTQQTEDQQAVADLRRQIASYSDPASVADQARLRLNYQMPNERLFLLPPAPPVVATDDDKVHTPAVPGKQDQPWYSQLWGSAVETSR